MIMSLTHNFLTFPDSGVIVGGNPTSPGYICPPSSYSVLMADVDLDDKRSTSAYLNRNRIRQNVYSVICSWDRLSNAQLQLLLSAIQAEKFSLTFRDPLNSTNMYTTKSAMYADANKEAELIVCEDDTTDYWSFSITFVEY